MDKKLIVYIHFANVAEDKKWESNFCHFLKFIIKQVFGDYPTFISNMELEDLTSNDQENLDKLQKSDAYIIVFNNHHKLISSKEYAIIKDLVNNLNTKQQNKIYVTRRFNDKEQDVPVVELRKFPTYNFFELNSRTLEIINFEQNLHGEDDNQYLLKLTDLVYEIKDSLSFDDKDNENLCNNLIYLAEVSSDQIRNRDRLKRSLMLSGYKVLPVNSLIKYDNYENEVKNNIEKCVLSIHMLGELYGETFPSSDYSFQELQNRYFQDVWQTQKDNNKSIPLIKRIIWLPPQLEPSEEKQIQYLKRINREINNSENTELIQSTLSDLKVLIDQKMKYISITNTLAVTEEIKDVLVVYDNDCNFSDKIKETFLNHNISVQFLNSPSILYSNNLRKLMDNVKKFHSYLVINTKSDSVWISSIINLLARSKGYEGSVLGGHVGLFITNPKTGFDNQTLLSIDPIVYNKTNLVEKLELFISKINP